MKRAAILFSDFGPYHVARIEALGRSLAGEGIELVAFRFTERSSTYGWEPVLPQGMETVTLAARYPAGPAAAARLAWRFGQELRQRRVGAVFLPTYSPLPNLLCLLAAKAAGCRTILMTESWLGTEKAGAMGRLAKHVLVRLFDAALVGGSPQTDFVVAYGMPREKVFTGYDVVDTDFFAARADAVRASRKGSKASVDGLQSEVGGLRSETGGPEALIKSLPERYFLNLGRFVEKKNLSTLVSAYARYVKGAVEGDAGRARPPDAPGSCVMESNTAGPEAQPYPGETSHSSHVTRHSPISLVLVGEGPLRADLERQAQELGLLVVDRDNSSPVAAVSDRRSSATGATDAEYCKLNTDHPVEQHGTVLFYGFQQSDTTPVFFALCEAFILPSLYEEWGLVVNEAMACGAPVIVSRNVGSARDLVEGTSVAPVSPPAGSAVIGGEDTAAAEGRVPLEERPGFTFDPHNVDELAKLLERFATDPTLKEKLGAAGRGIIRSWTPERFGQSGLKAFEAALAV